MHLVKCQFFSLKGAYFTCRALLVMRHQSVFHEPAEGKQRLSRGTTQLVECRPSRAAPRGAEPSRAEPSRAEPSAGERSRLTAQSCVHTRFPSIRSGALKTPNGPSRAFPALFVEPQPRPCRKLRQTTLPNAKLAKTVLNFPHFSRRLTR